jgi:hypothetical protein
VNPVYTNCVEISLDPWPVHSDVEAALKELRAEHSTGPTWEREAAIREGLVARNLAPELWLERVMPPRFQRTPMAPDDAVAPSRLTHAAFCACARNADQVAAVDAIARTVLAADPVRLVWAAAEQVLITILRERVTLRAVYVQNIDGTQTPYDVTGTWWDPARTAKSAGALYREYRDLHPAWEPLFEHGVVPLRLSGRTMVLLRPAQGSRFELFRRYQTSTTDRIVEPGAFGKLARFLEYGR